MQTLSTAIHSAIQDRAGLASCASAPDYSSHICRLAIPDNVQSWLTSTDKGTTALSFEAGLLGPRKNAGLWQAPVLSLMLLPALPSAKAAACLIFAAKSLSSIYDNFLLHVLHFHHLLRKPALMVGRSDGHSPSLGLSVMAVSLDQSASGPMLAMSSARAPPPKQSLKQNKEAAGAGTSSWSWAVERPPEEHRQGGVSKPRAVFIAWPCHDLTSDTVFTCKSCGPEFKLFTTAPKCVRTLLIPIALHPGQLGTESRQKAQKYACFLRSSSLASLAAITCDQ